VAVIELDEARVRGLIEPFVVLRTLRRFARGWDDEVWLADERWAFRFPHRAGAVEGVRLEIAALPRLAPQLPVPIPVPRCVTDRPFSGAELIDGGEGGVPARGLGEFLREDQLLRARVWALVCCAGLLEQALGAGEARAARAALERAAC
jgi:hypothetical protein